MKEKLMIGYIGVVCYRCLNISFQCLNNIICIFIHFFIYIYFQKIQITLLEISYQTDLWEPAMFNITMWQWLPHGLTHDPITSMHIWQLQCLEYSQWKIVSYPNLPSQKATLSIIPYHFTTHPTSQFLFYYSTH